MPRVAQARLCRALIGHYMSGAASYRGTSVSRKTIVAPSLFEPDARAPTPLQLEDAVDYIIIGTERHPCVHLGHWGMQYDEMYWYNVAETISFHMYGPGAHMYRHYVWGYCEQNGVSACVLSVDPSLVATTNEMTIHVFGELGDKARDHLQRMERVLALITIRDGQGVETKDVNKDALRELATSLGQRREIKALSEDATPETVGYACLEAIEGFLSGKTERIALDDLKGRYFSKTAR